MDIVKGITNLLCTWPALIPIPEHCQKWILSTERGLGRHTASTGIKLVHMSCTLSTLVSFSGHCHESFLSIELGFSPQAQSTPSLTSTPTKLPRNINLESYLIFHKSQINSHYPLGKETECPMIDECTKVHIFTIEFSEK